MKRIDVVAGVIYNPERSRVLIALRSADRHQGNLWEFPGGKIEAAETSEQALCRELHEELGIRCLACQPYLKVDFDYSDKHVCIDFWLVTRFSGTPAGLERQQIRWVRLEELERYDFPAANATLVSRLLAQGERR